MSNNSSFDNVEYNLDDISVESLKENPQNTGYHDSGVTEMRNARGYANLTPQMPQDADPAIVLFGPPQCGKSMVLKRLWLYLKANGFKLEPYSKLYPNNESYSAECRKFESEMKMESDLMAATPEFLLVKASNGDRCFYILEAPGEHYFEPNKAKQEAFREYQRALMTGTPKARGGHSVVPRPMYYIFFLEKYEEQETVNRYQDRMIDFYDTFVRPNDKAKAILLYNKADEKWSDEPQSWASPLGVRPKGYSKMLDIAESMYPRIFHCNDTKFLWMDLSNYVFIPFSSGTFNHIDGKFNQSADSYPKDLLAKMNIL